MVSMQSHGHCVHMTVHFIPVRAFTLSWIISWFQTSLPLAALLLRRMITACHFRVTALSGHTALSLSPSGIAPELNRIQLSAVCQCGQSGKVIDLLARHCLPLGLPSAASGACAVVQKSPSKRQCSERQASLKAALGLHMTFDGVSSKISSWRHWLTANLKSYLTVGIFSDVTNSDLSLQNTILPDISIQTINPQRP